MVLPAHSSHRTQPLDVGIFGPLKRELAKYTDHRATYHAQRIPKAEWAAGMVLAREKAMTRENIKV